MPIWDNQRTIYCFLVKGISRRLNCNKLSRGKSFGLIIRVREAKYIPFCFTQRVGEIKRRMMKKNFFLNYDINFSIENFFMAVKLSRFLKLCTFRKKYINQKFCEIGIRKNIRSSFFFSSITLNNTFPSVCLLWFCWWKYICLRARHPINTKILLTLKYSIFLQQSNGSFLEFTRRTIL